MKVNSNKKATKTHNNLNQITTTNINSHVHKINHTPNKPQNYHDSQNPHDKLIYYLSFIGFFAIFSSTISKNPVLSLFANALNANATLVGLIASASPIAGILISFPVGVLSDKIGYKKVLIFSGLIFVTAPLLYLFINNPWWLIAIRFFHGFATAILGPVSSAMILLKYGKSKGEKLGLYYTFRLTGRSLAPIVGGFIITYFAYFGNLLNYRFVYLCAFLASLPALILLLFIKPSKQKKEAVSYRTFKDSLLNFIRNKNLLSTSFVQMSIYFAAGAYEAFLPIYMKANHFEASQIGIIFSLQIIMIAISKPFFGRIADKTNKKIQILTGFLLTNTIIVFVPFIKNYLLLITQGMLFGLFISMSTIAISTYIADIAKKDEMGASIGALSSIMDIGHWAGPFFTGIIIASSSYFLGFLTSFLLSIIVALVFIAYNFKIKTSHNSILE